jgi:Lysine methyltransferase
MMLAKARPEWQLVLTDLPRLMPLIARNLALNFAPVILDADSLRFGSIERNLSEYVMYRYRDRSVFASYRQSSRIQSQVLVWSEEEDESSSGNRQTFDIIAGADVVASIYNPIALARTIHRLAHSESTVYISFKERLTTIHREFEEQLSDLFEDVQIVPPSPHAFRNRNPQVQILVARMKKPMSCVDG